ncbi:TetR/AcrR family transcriptional regulator [Embleya sp. NPDC050493]|uniref:TetR/AcrR family transcriptional regulator n=1 Tax=Embleya sp. NPDC050493 TaxID=3363989 RepID=UPI0037A88095
MSVPKGASLDPVRTREMIAESAAQLLYERGLDGVGVAELCASAGISKEPRYRHFGSKDGLIEAIPEKRSRGVLAWITDAAAAAGPDSKARITDAAAAAGPDSKARIAAVFHALGMGYATPGFRGCAIVNAATQRHTAPADRIAARHLTGYRDLLNGIARASDASDPDALGLQLLVILEGATVVADHLGIPDASATALSASLTLLDAAASPRA